MITSNSNNSTHKAEQVPRWILKPLLIVKVLQKQPSIILLQVNHYFSVPSTERPASAMTVTQATNYTSNTTTPELYK